MATDTGRRGNNLVALPPVALPLPPGGSSHCYSHCFSHYIRPAMSAQPRIDLGGSAGMILGAHSSLAAEYRGFILK
jgi:hypothetical protein